MKSIEKPLRSITYSLVSLVMACYLLEWTAFIFVPIAWSVFLGIALMPLCDRLERTLFPRQLAILTSIALVTAFAGVILYFLIDQVMSLLEHAPALENKLEVYLADVEAFFIKTFGVEPGLGNNTWSLSELINGQHIRNLLQSTAETLIALGIIPVYIFFIIYYKDFFGEFMRQSTAKTGRKPLSWTREASLMIQNYLTGLLIVTMIVALMAGIVFYLVGVKYFLFFALFVAVFNLIPYIGVIFSSAVSTIYVFLITDSIWYPLLTLILLWGTQLIENNLIMPLIVGSKIRLNPLAVIIAVMIGGWIWGLSGMILFIPLVGVLKIIFDKTDYLTPYGYLLGTDIPEMKTNKSYLVTLKRRR